jgi:hypothetical protein
LAHKTSGPCQLGICMDGLREWWGLMGEGLPRQKVRSVPPPNSSFFLRWSLLPFPVGRFLLQSGYKTTTITRHHCHHFPTFINGTPEPIP